MPMRGIQMIFEASAQRLEEFLPRPSSVSLSARCMYPGSTSRSKIHNSFSSCDLPTPLLIARSLAISRMVYGCLKNGTNDMTVQIRSIPGDELSKRAGRILRESRLDHDCWWLVLKCYICDEPTQRLRRKEPGLGRSKGLAMGTSRL